MKYSSLILTVCIAAMAVLPGCGPKPVAPPPADVSVETAINALKKQADLVKTLSASARVRAKDARNDQSANASITCRFPRDFKTVFYGFGGIEMAEFASHGDSIVLYIPFYNAYINTSQRSNPLGALFPEFDIDPARIFSLIAGPVLPPDLPEQYQITFTRSPDGLELVFARDEMVYRYLLMGPQLLVAEETVTDHDALVWNIARDDYALIDDVSFPRRIVISDERRSLRFDFSNLSINAELSADAFTVVIPDDANPITLRGR